jgi:GT2 family glycosyltransferase
MRRAVIDTVVATRDSRELVLRCIDHLRSPLLERVVVVDNGSTDGTSRAVRERRPEVEVIRLDEPQGLSSAYNRGAAACSGELILFLNDDVFVSDDGISELSSALGRRPTAVAASARLVDPRDGRTQEEYLPRSFPGSLALAASLVGKSRPPAELDGDEVVAVDQPPGACLLVRRSAFEAAGRWDENYEFWFEDVDLARRLRVFGEVLYVPGAAFPHVGGASARRLASHEVVARHYRGALLYAQGHLGFGGRAITAPAYALSAAVRVVTARDADARRAYSGVLRDSLRLVVGRGVRPR